MTARTLIRERLQAGIALRAQLEEACSAQIVLAAERIVAAYRAGGKLLLCGNGGSAADCQHMATELVSQLRHDVKREGLPAIALTTDTSYLTAFANDHGYEGVFARQVQAIGRAGDVLLGISTSGNSKNVVAAFREAKERGVTTLALTGSGGALAPLADLAIQVPSTDTQLIQEMHLAIEHLLCELVELAWVGRL
jgi:D-sedoheptulose 7-phosphate isomerase